MTSFNNITVVAHVGVICAALVLERFDWCCKINLALEKLFTLDLVQLLDLVGEIVVRLSDPIVHVQRIHAHVLHLRTHLLSFITLRSMLLVLVEV